MFVKIAVVQVVKTICVCGAGTMGSGIAQVAAASGFDTIQFDVNRSMLEKSKLSIEHGLQKLLEKNKVTAEEKRQILDRIVFTDAIADCRADLVIEAIVEDKKAKVELFNQLSNVNNPQTIFATNTSSISVSAIAAEIVNPGRVAGMHFFNPAPLMKLVELIGAPVTAPETITLLADVCRQMGKVPVLCSDAPGFIVNRVARQYYLEAMELVLAGVVDISTVDAAMEAAGFRMGPFRLMDLIGMDVNFAVSNIVWEALGKPGRLTPSPLQQQKVETGELGRKTGKGFYQY